MTGNELALAKFLERLPPGREWRRTDLPPFPAVLIAECHLVFPFTAYALVGELVPVNSQLARSARGLHGMLAIHVARDGALFVGHTVDLWPDTKVEPARLGGAYGFPAGLFRRV